MTTDEEHIAIGRAVKHHSDTQTKLAALDNSLREAASFFDKLSREIHARMTDERLRSVNISLDASAARFGDLAPTVALVADRVATANALREAKANLQRMGIVTGAHITP